MIIHNPEHNSNSQTQQQSRSEHQQSISTEQQQRLAQNTQQQQRRDAQQPQQQRSVNAHDNVQQAQQQRVQQQGGQANQIAEQKQVNQVQSTTTKPAKNKQTQTSEKGENIIKVFAQRDFEDVEKIAKFNASKIDKNAINAIKMADKKEKFFKRKIKTYDDCLDVFKDLIIELLKEDLNEFQISNYLQSHLKDSTQKRKKMALVVPPRQIKAYIKKRNLIEKVNAIRNQ